APARQYLGDADEAEEFAVLAYETHQRIGDERASWWSAQVLAQIKLVKGLFGEAVRLNEAAVDNARRNGNAGGLAVSLFGLGATLFRTGEIDLARDVLEDSLSLWQEWGGRTIHCYTLETL